MLSTLTPPGGPLLAVNDDALRQHLRLLDGETDGNDLLAALIQTATAQAEAHTRRRFLTQTVRLTLDGFGSWGREATPLPVAPIQSVSQVQYLDDAGIWRTVDAVDYRVIDSVEPHELWPAFGRTWPVPKREPAVVRIDLVVGYGPDASDVPADILHAVRMIVAHLEQHPEAVTTGPGTPAETPLGVRTLLDPHRIWF